MVNIYDFCVLPVMGCTYSSIHDQTIRSGDILGYALIAISMYIIYKNIKPRADSLIDRLTFVENNYFDLNMKLMQVEKEIDNIKTRLVDLEYYSDDSDYRDGSSSSSSGTRIVKATIVKPKVKSKSIEQKSV